MAEIHNEQLAKVYNASTTEEAQEAYDEWAAKYEADVFAHGFRSPANGAATFARFVEVGEGPILDAGCGTGLQSEALSQAGYGPITGIDLSPGMLSVARHKGIYAELHQMALGETLAFDDDTFAHTISTGAITPGHAPPNSFDDIIRVTRPGGMVVFSLRTDAAQEPEYPAAIEEYEAAGRWSKIYESAEFVTMPFGEPDVLSKIYVYKVL